MAFESRKVSGGGVNLFGGKQKHPELKKYNGEEVLVDATRDENGHTVIVVVDEFNDLICCMSQQSY